MNDCEICGDSVFYSGLCFDCFDRATLPDCERCDNCTNRALIYGPDGRFCDYCAADRQPGDYWPNNIA